MTYKMKSDKDVLADLQAQKRARKTLREIAVQYAGITHGDIFRALNGVMPHNPHKRLALGLPAYKSVPACSVCGGVHLLKSCPIQRAKQWHELFDIPSNVLRWQLDNREVL
jgi:hypothetical protein